MWDLSAVPVVVQGGSSALLGVVVWAILTGRLVPRATMLDRLADRKAAHDADLRTLAELRRQLDVLYAAAVDEVAAALAAQRERRTHRAIRGGGEGTHREGEPAAGAPDS